MCKVKKLLVSEGGDQSLYSRYQHVKPPYLRVQRGGKLPAAITRIGDEPAHSTTVPLVIELGCQDTLYRLFRYLFNRQGSLYGFP